MGVDVPGHAGGGPGNLAAGSRAAGYVREEEIGFFASSGRRIASVAAASDGQVLILRRRCVDELMKDDPACAAEVLFGLARVLADRQYAPAS